MPPPFPPIDPETLLIVGVVGGIFAMGTYVLYKVAEQEGGKLDFLPKVGKEGGLPKPRLPKLMWE